eukprot:m.58448 g.58448  ORF g.58448 m.58448 type:complete len:142 (+) comp34814_c0_seq1:1559-1984(+)
MPKKKRSTFTSRNARRLRMRRQKETKEEGVLRRQKNRQRQADYRFNQAVMSTPKKAEQMDGGKPSQKGEVLITRHAAQTIEQMEAIRQSDRERHRVLRIRCKKRVGKGSVESRLTEPDDEKQTGSQQGKFRQRQWHVLFTT